jgi:tetratricopeptide (TPR) repeat protein
LDRASALVEQRRWDEAMNALKEHELITLDQKAIAARVDIVSTGQDSRPRSLQINYAYQAIVFAERGCLQEAEAAWGKVLTVASDPNAQEEVKFEKDVKLILAQAYRSSGAEALEQSEFDEAKVRLGAALKLYQELEVPEAIEVVQTVLNDLASRD